MMTGDSWAGTVARSLVNVYMNTTSSAVTHSITDSLAQSYEMIAAGIGKSWIYWKMYSSPFLIILNPIAGVGTS